MYKDDYISAFGKLAPSEAWKAETLAKMRALEKRREDGRAGLDGVLAADRAPQKRPAPFAVRLRRAALPVAAAAMLAILPLTMLRGCGASSGAPMLQMENAAMDSGAPAADTAPRDTAGGTEYGTYRASAEAPSGEAATRDAVTNEEARAAGSAPNMAPAPAPQAGRDGNADANIEGNPPARKEFDLAWGGRPFRGLEASALQAASVSLTPPDITLEIEDTQELLGLLQDVVVYGRDDSYTEYSGQGVTFLLTFADGAQTQIMAYDPFLVIDGAGYRAKAAPCKALSRYANALLESGEAVTVLSRPPVLSVMGTLDEVCHSALQGGYSWQSKNADGTLANAEADGAHPLACKAQLSPALEMTYDLTLNLIFPEGAAPDEIVHVRCWSDADWGSTAAKSETVRVFGSAAEGYAIELKPGGHVYEVTARWDAADGYGGTASYVFYVKGID